MIEKKLKIEIGAWATLIQFPNGYWVNPSHIEELVIRQVPFTDDKHHTVVVALTKNWGFEIICENMDEAKTTLDELAQFVCHGGKSPTPSRSNQPAAGQ